MARYRRKRMTNRRSKRLFARTGRKVHKKNLRRTLMRGGYRL